MKKKCKDCGNPVSKGSKGWAVRCRTCYYKHVGDDNGRPWLNREWLIDKYFNKKLSFTKIAELAGTTPTTIEHAFQHKFNLKGRQNKTGKDNPSWKGGRTYSYGYVLVYHPKPHAFKRRNGSPYVYEHILVAEKTLGRKLSRPEVVHHKNGIRDDNRPENLQVMRSQSEHRILEEHLNSFAKRITFGELAPHLKDELQCLFTQFLSKNG